MTYCIGLFLQTGLVMMADTRTNAGLDNISSYRKLTVWQSPGERVIALMTAGNLAVSQAVVNLLEEGFDPSPEAADADSDLPGDLAADVTTNTVPSMFLAARLVGRAVRQVWRDDAEAMQAQDTAFNVSMILGGQIKGRRMRLFRIYAAGNFIEATPDTPYFQIGEHKYGKPILDRAVDYESDPKSAVKLCLVSMDSTIRSNLSVGPPVDLLLYHKDQLKLTLERRIEANDSYYAEVSNLWSEALRQAYTNLPDPPWLNGD